MYPKNLGIGACILGVAVAQNLSAALSSNPDLSTLNLLISNSPGLLDLLGGATNTTLLAPSNEALQKFNNSPEYVKAFLQPDYLHALLQYHVLLGTYPASSFANGTTVPTLLDNATYSNVTGGQRVKVQKSGDIVTFYTGLDSHANISKADQNFTGGIIQIIDTILSLPVNISETLEAKNLTAALDALQQAGLEDTLDAGSNLTLFIPNNEALNAAASTIQNATDATLKALLSYHVVQGGVVGYSGSLKNGTSVETLNGGSLKFQVENDQVFVNSAKVVIPDLLVANGVIHVIDSVLNPNSTSVFKAPPFANSSVASTVSLASTDSLTSTVPLPSTVPLASTDSLTSTVPLPSTVPSASTVSSTPASNSTSQP